MFSYIFASLHRYFQTSYKITWWNLLWMSYATYWTCLIGDPRQVWFTTNTCGECDVHSTSGVAEVICQSYFGFSSLYDKPEIVVSCHVPTCCWHSLHYTKLQRAAFAAYHPCRIWCVVYLTWFRYTLCIRCDQCHCIHIHCATKPLQVTR